MIRFLYFIAPRPAFTPDSMKGKQRNHIGPADNLGNLLLRKLANLQPLETWAHGPKLLSPPEKFGPLDDLKKDLSRRWK